MHVLLNALSAVSGGSITYLRDAVPELAAIFAAQDEHRLTVLLHRSQEGLLPAHVPVSRIVLDGAMPKGWRRLAYEKSHISSYLRDVDVYFVPYQACHIPAGVRSVVMLRNMEPFLHWRYAYDPKSRLRNIILRHLSLRTLRKADHVIAVSPFAQQQLLNKLAVPAARISTIPHGCSPAFAESASASDCASLKHLGIDGDYIFTSGSFLPYRRLEDVIEAFVRIARRKPGLKLVITGTGTDRRYKTKIEKAIRGARADIISLGQVDVSTMALLYRRSIAFVTATEIEACPNIVLEAMTARCAVIAPNHPPMPELIGERGIYFQPRRTDELAERIMTVAEDAGLRQALRRQAGLPDFSWRHCAERTFEALTLPR